MSADRAQSRPGLPMRHALNIEDGSAEFVFSGWEVAWSF